MTVAIFWQFQLKPFLAFPYHVAPHGSASFWQFANETTLGSSKIVTGKEVAFFGSAKFWQLHFLQRPFVGTSWLELVPVMIIQFTSLAIFGNLYIYHHDLALP